MTIGRLTVHPHRAASENRFKIRTPAAAGFIEDRSDIWSWYLDLSGARDFPDLSEKPQPGQRSGRVDLGEPVLDDHLIGGAGLEGNRLASMVSDAGVEQRGDDVATGKHVVGETHG